MSPAAPSSPVLDTLKTLSPTQFNASLSPYLAHPSGTMLDLLFQAFDTNGDRQLSFREFVIGVHTLLRSQPEEKRAWFLQVSSPCRLCSTPSFLPSFLALYLSIGPALFSIATGPGFQLRRLPLPSRPSSASRVCSSGASQLGGCCFSLTGSGDPIATSWPRSQSAAFCRCAERGLTTKLFHCDLCSGRYCCCCCYELRSRDILFAVLCELCYQRAVLCVFCVGRAGAFLCSFGRETMQLRGPEPGTPACCCCHSCRLCH
jgi:hypothetical protein